MAGRIHLRSIEDGSKNHRLIGVQMGAVQKKASDVPVRSFNDSFMNEEINVDEKVYTLSSIRMGVPHTVVVVESMNDINVIKVGSEIEKMDIFPENTNVNFVEVLSKDHIKVDTWERGAGHTLACGTGVCSAVYITHENGLTNEKVTVDVPGGRLFITLNGDEIYMEGQAVFICEGNFVE